MVKIAKSLHNQLENPYCFSFQFYSDIIDIQHYLSLGFTVSLVDKESTCNVATAKSLQSCPTLRPAMLETPIWFLGCVGKICWRRDRLPTPVFLGFPCGSAGKESTCNMADLGSIPLLGRYPGEGKGYTLQYSGLENSMESRSPWGSKGHDWATFTFKKEKKSFYF